jgi:uncharacterized protein YcnI
MRLPSVAPRGLAPRILLLAAFVLLVPAERARAHVTVWPRAAARGAYERYVVRVPNEKDVPTTRVEIRFPAAVRISSFQDVPGWALEVLTDSAGKIVGAVWTGTLPPKRFVELPFIGVNPRDGDRIVWPAYQTYADGQRVEWTGAPGSKSPASVTTLTVGPGGASTPVSLYVGVAALLVALLGLGLVLRRPTSTGA